MPRLSVPQARLCVIVTALCVFAASCGGNEDDAEPTPTTGAAEDTVSVLGIWNNEELASFEAVVESWDGAMQFTGTRDITNILATRVEADNPPDVAIPAEVGSLQRFAREGKLTPLSACPGLEEMVREHYPQAYIDLGTVDGTLYGFFMKADTKATIFYSPKFFEAHALAPLSGDATFADLQALAQRIRDTGTPPWSMGQEAEGSSGFPGSDTIQQIILNEAGPEVYDGLIAGRTPFTDAEVKAAWEQFGAIALTPGSVAQAETTGINTTGFEVASLVPFEDPPGAGMTHIGGFASGFISDAFPAAVPGEDFDFFPWPGGGITGGANVAFAFNSDPATCSFLSHIAGADAQEVWVKRGAFTSLNTGVSLDMYPDAVSRRQAEQLTSAEVFRFDLDDAIGGTTQLALFQGVLDYLSDPASLDAILQRIEDTRP